MEATAHAGVLDQTAAEFYRSAMRALEERRLPFLVGGAYAFAQYTGIVRHTCDFDIFVSPEQAPTVLDALGEAGWRTELSFPHWLGKAYQDDFYVDVIYSSGSGIAVVDREWFDNSTAGTVLGMPVRLIPAEEMIWSKSFIMERERYDGNDVAHVILRRGASLDWSRLLRRFGRHWRVLLAHLVLFDFIYPAERDQIPAEVRRELIERLGGRERSGPDPDARRETDPSAAPLCQGTLLSRAQYLVDVGEWGYRDARLSPDVRMTEEDIAHWTRAIEA
jgi:nucleotidyltransferase DUF2204